MLSERAQEGGERVGNYTCIFLSANPDFGKASILYLQSMSSPFLYLTLLISIEMPYLTFHSPCTSVHVGEVCRSQNTLMFMVKCV